MSVHEQFAEDLALYALGVLQGDERVALEKHLEGCTACRRELEQLRGDMALMALSTAGPVPPRRARQRLLEAVAREPRRAAAPAERGWWTLIPWVVAAAAVPFDACANQGPAVEPAHSADDTALNAGHAALQATKKL